MSEIILEVKNLKTQFFTNQGIVKAVDGISFSLEKGKVLGIVGESGSGKSVTSLSILKLLPKPAGKIVDGEIWYRGENLVSKTQKEMRQYRGKNLFMISQNPMSSLNPVFTIRNQMAEAIPGRKRMPKHELSQKIINMLNLVHIAKAERRINLFPHQFSGGMRQRVMISMALTNQPEVLIADEPTTALDVTVQAQVLRLMEEIRRDYAMSIIMITHDLGVVANFCDQVLVMYAGKMFEKADVDTLFSDHRHPYTKGLIKSLPRLGVKQNRLSTIKGQPPDLLNLNQGCPFEPRCDYADKVCRESFPPVEEVKPGHQVACWNWRKLA